MTLWDALDHEMQRLGLSPPTEAQRAMAVRVAKAVTALAVEEALLEHERTDAET